MVVIVLLTVHLSDWGFLDGSSLGRGLSVFDILLSIFLAGAINSDLDSNLTSFNLLAVHLGDSLLLELLRGESDEAEATALASLTTSLKLLDHEAGNGAKSDLGRDRVVDGEQLLELQGC